MPDKGERLRTRRKEIADALEEVKERERILKTAELPVDIQALEWRDIEGSVKTTIERSTSDQRGRSDCLDSDDDEDLDPLELMARHSSCVKKPIHRRSLSDEEDPAEVIARELEQIELRDAQESNEKSEGQTRNSESTQKAASGNTTLDFGTKRIQMLELKRLRNGEVRVPFKPFRPVADPEPIPALQKLIESHRPKPGRKIQLISLQESITLERDYLSKMKERDLKKTTETLARMKNENMKIGLPPKSSTLKYRDINVNEHLLDSDEEEATYLPANADYEYEDEEYDDY